MGHPRHSLNACSYRYRADYITKKPPINEAQRLDLKRAENDLNIYLKDKDEAEVDELTRYLAERRAPRAVSKYSYILLYLKTIN